MTNIFKSPLSILIVITTCLALQAGEWANWRGPNYVGSADEANLPVNITGSKNQAWATDLPGEGYSTPVVKAGRIYLTSMEDKNSLAMCFDANTGKELWRQQTGTTTQQVPRNILATPSPAVGDNRVYFLFGNGYLVAYDLEGNKQWDFDLVKTYGNLSYNFGFSTSPLLHDSKLYIQICRRNRAIRSPQTAQPLDSYLLALDAQSGKEVFRQIRPTDAIEETQESYATALPYTQDGVTEILVMGGDHVTGHDPQTGKENWRVKFNFKEREEGRVVPCLTFGSNLIFGAMTKHEGIYAIKLDRSGAQPKAEIVWRFDGPAPDCSTPCYYKDRLYVMNDIGGGRTMSCLDPATGKPLWQGDISGKGPWRASFSASDDKLYCISETGDVVVVAAGGDAFKILFQGKIDEKPALSTIAIANQSLYIRTGKKLRCIRNAN